MNLKRMPLITIITPCLNRAQFIEKAIQSVLDQSYSNIEHIVVDGGSTDGTLDILKKYSHLRVISEPDKGVYDAMNKGILLAQGEIIGLLNSDDYYENDILDGVSEKFYNKAIDAICGAAVFINVRGKIISQVKSINQEGMLDQILYGPPIINAWFFRKDYLVTLLPFNRNYSLAADREFLIRAYQKGIRISCVPDTIYYYLQHKGSLTINTDRKIRISLIKENLKISNDYLNDRNMTLHDDMKKWFMYLSEEGMKTALRIGSTADFFRFFFDVLKRNPLWLLLILRSSLSEFDRLIEKGQK